MSVIYVGRGIYVCIYIHTHTRLSLGTCMRYVCTVVCPYRTAGAGGGARTRKIAGGKERGGAMKPRQMKESEKESKGSRAGQVTRYPYVLLERRRGTLYHESDYVMNLM